MADNRLDCSFSDQLRIEGVNFKGFGIIPKYVMLDPDLSIEAKTIYAYFCSYAGNGNTTFPSRDKILVDLPMSKDAYYKHFRQLTDQGYITVQQDKGDRSSFANNVYTLVSNPKKFEDKPEDTKHALAYSRIRFSGLKAAGFGMIPKAVMLDPRLTVKAKGIYAYFCSFTGSGNNAFPKKEKILYHLGITHNTYQKFYKLLTDLNYITAVQRHIDGRLSVNDYYLNDTPDEANATPKAVISLSTQDTKIQDTVQFTVENQDTKIQDTASGDPQIQDTKLQDTAKQDTEIQDTRKQDTEKQDANITRGIINNPAINNSEYNHSLYQQPAQPELSERESDEEIEFEVEEELLGKKQLPYWYKQDERRMTAAIRLMTDWHTFKTGYRDDLEQRVYLLFVEALIEMCQADKMTLKGAYVSYAKVIDKLNELAKFTSTYVDLSEFSDVAMNNFKQAAVDKDIKNPMQYMKSCIWDAMQTGSIGMYADLRRMGY